ncbi:TetR family transcriptional regulator [Tsukamurella sp. 8F]|uniref:TetR/AcrR family transcriptional regulator n=1 Tax=unclassified Tsukamurella TaxID=2633480 RepID=UPI0023B8E8B0|nr:MULTISPECIES: TetR family transcriptional regulator [unclassified Tsukamurella]MDF0530002.1 TetR family transcriptional regulator [Tsukamurella sp. 8J]MDF0587226.1 TetR family transcriptional regulator [Tsukamurella sp. 8F]
MSIAPERRPRPTRQTRSGTADAALDAVALFLADHEWSQVTMAAVARQAGVSRQTLYNEFGNRQGLAIAYVTRFIDGLLLVVEHRLDEHPGDIAGAMQAALADVFTIGFEDPLVRGIVGPNPHRDLLATVTVDGTPALHHAAVELADVLVNSWAMPERAEAAVAASTLVRLVFSHLTLQLGEPADSAREIVLAIGPFLERAVRG